MNFTAKRRVLNKIRKKLSNRQGFSLGELLAATIILLLASQVMAQGIAFGARMYNQSLTRSHAKQLCSTLTNVIETELRYTTSISTDANGELKSYFSPTYGKTYSNFEAIDEKGKEITSADEGGEIAIEISNDDNKKVWQRLISSASYSSYGLKARVRSVKKENENLFHVILDIRDKDGNKLITNEFDVIPVNKLT
ncbi:hypothetical protein [Blautia sp.]